MPTSSSLRDRFVREIKARLLSELHRLDHADTRAPVVLDRVKAFCAIEAVGKWLEFRSEELPEGDAHRADLHELAGKLYDLSHEAWGLGSAKK